MTPKLSPIQLCGGCTPPRHPLPSQLPGRALILFGAAMCLTNDYLSQPLAESLGGTSGG